MTDFYQSQLDAHPDDAVTRLLLAEYLDERGDPDAAGYRWMAERAKRPWPMNWCWSNDVGVGPHSPSTLPDAIRLALKGGQVWGFGSVVSVEFYTRRDAEAALCRVVSEMQKEALRRANAGL